MKQGYVACLTGARRSAYEAWDGINPEVKAVLEGFAVGVKQYMADYPEGLLPNARQIDAREVLALNQFILLGRQLNQARQDHRRRGIRLYRAIPTCPGRIITAGTKNTISRPK